LFSDPDSLNPKTDQAFLNPKRIQTKVFYDK
jgi:hypothetical protein